MRGRTTFVLIAALVAAPAYAGHRFHASAVALGGAGSPTVAAVALSPGGGVARAAQRSFDDGFVRFASARSVVRGWRRGGVALTISEVVIQDLDIGGRIHADRLIVRLQERHLPGRAEAEISLVGSALENLSIDGARVDTALDLGYFDRLPTFAAASQALASSSNALQCNACGSGGCDSPARAAGTIVIPDLGTLHIGEVVIRPGWRELTMLRLERSTGGWSAGEKGDGDTTIGSVEGNGTPPTGGP